MPAAARAGTVPDRIGPLGRVARVAVGLALILLALFWRDPEWWDAVLGLVVAPALLLALLSWHAHRSPEPLRATGPVAHAVNLGIGLPLLVLPATAGAAFLFYGASMLLAAGRANGGCEVTALPNVVLGRDDQVGCVLFGPVDLAEEQLAARRGASATLE